MYTFRLFLEHIEKVLFADIGSTTTISLLSLEVTDWNYSVCVKLRGNAVLLLLLSPLARWNSKPFPRKGALGCSK